MSQTEFEGVFGEALDLIPPRVLEQLENIVFLVEDEHDTDNVLGLYEGVPLVDRSAFGGGWLPDRITIYRLPLLRMCSSRQELRHEVAVTVVHEIAHYFGIDDDRLHELGWG